MITKPKNSAVTLLELLVVVMIMGILASIAVTVYTGHVDRARVAACRDMIRQLELAINRYEVDTGQLPPSSSGLTLAPDDILYEVSGGGSFGSGYLQLALSHSLSGNLYRPLHYRWLGPYIELDEDQIGDRFGMPPKASTPQGYVQILDPWGNPYYYLRADHYSTMGGTQYPHNHPFYAAETYYNPSSFQIFSLGRNGTTYAVPYRGEETDDVNNWRKYGVRFASSGGGGRRTPVSITRTDTASSGGGSGTKISRTDSAAGRNIDGSRISSIHNASASGSGSALSGGGQSASGQGDSNIGKDSDSTGSDSSGGMKSGSLGSDGSNAQDDTRRTVPIIFSLPDGGSITFNWPEGWEKNKQNVMENLKDKKAGKWLFQASNETTQEQILERYKQYSDARVIQEGPDLTGTVSDAKVLIVRSKSIPDDDLRDSLKDKYYHIVFTFKYKDYTCWWTENYKTEKETEKETLFITGIVRNRKQDIK